jgi:hypothetical protein
MPKRTVTVTLPDRDWLQDLTDLYTAHPRLRAAEQALAEAEGRLAERRADVAARQRDADILPAAVNTGRAAAADLEAALVAARAAALRVGPAERAVTAARATVARERTMAREAFGARYLERLAGLVAAAAAVTPILEQLRTLEAALDQRYRAVLDTVPPGAVEWPTSLVDEGRRQAALFVR